MYLRDDALVISQKRFHGWILDAFWRESSKVLGLNPRAIYLYSDYKKNKMFKKRSLAKISSRKPVLSIHQSNLSLLEDTGILDGIRQHNVVVTHVTSNQNFSELGRYYGQNRNISFLVMNKKTQLTLINLGVPRDRIIVIYGAIDRKDFYPDNQSRIGDYVLIAGDCKPRKNPNLIRDLVLKNPELEFIFENREWGKVLSDCKDLLNVSFWDSRVLSRGDLYRNASVLCNLSFLEGGPIPILQALASGTPVLSSDVGFVGEVVKEGFGRVIDLGLSIQEISTHLREVALTKESVSTMDGLEGKYSWEELGQKLFTFTE